MGQGSIKGGLVAVLIGAVAFFQASRSEGCGVSLDLPANHFDGVNEQGQLSYWKKIGEIDLGRGLKLPLIVNFRSGRETASPYLGKGWILAPLDSSMVQVDENKFLMLQPNGARTYFSRGKPTDTVLYGQGTWMAEIKDNTITAWASCGAKMVFKDGRLTSFNIGDQTLDLAYYGDRVTEVTDLGRTVLKVETNPQTSVVSGLSYGDKHIAIELGQKPQVQVAAGKNVVGGMDRSLSKLTEADGTVLKCEFAVDQALDPTIKITENGTDRLMSWNPASQLILTDGDWTYDIRPTTDPFAMVPVGRTNKDNQKEFWYKDNVNGQETTQTLDGTKVIKSWFTSGKLAGRLRAIEFLKEGETLDKISFAYDENGSVIRSTRSGWTKEKASSDNGSYKFTNQKGKSVVIGSNKISAGDLSIKYSSDLGGSVENSNVVYVRQKDGSLTPKSD